MTRANIKQDRFLQSLCALTIFLVASLEAGAVVALLTTVVTLATVLRVLQPRYKASIFYQALTLLDVTTFAQVMRKRMNRVGGTRRASIVIGTILHFGVLYVLMILVTQGLYLTNLENGMQAFVPPMSQEITIGSVFLAAIFFYLLIMGWFLVGYGYYRRFGEHKSIIEFAKSFRSNNNKSAETRSSLWSRLDRRAKAEYISTLSVGFSLMMVEIYELGFIASPAQTFGTSLEPKFENLVLSAFGSWQNVLLAEVLDLGLIGVTLWVMTKVASRISARFDGPETRYKESLDTQA